MRQEGIPVSARRPEHDLSLLGKNHPSASGCPHAVHRRRLRRSETPKAFGQDFPDPPLPLQSLPPVQGTTPTVDIRDRDLDQVPQLVDASLRQTRHSPFWYLVLRITERREVFKPAALGDGPSGRAAGRRSGFRPPPTTLASQPRLEHPRGDAWLPPTRRRRSFPPSARPRRSRGGPRPDRGERPRAATALRAGAFQYSSSSLSARFGSSKSRDARPTATMFARIFGPETISSSRRPQASRAFRFSGS